MPPSFVEAELRASCDAIAVLDLSLFDAKNDNARAGRRNAMCNKVSAAANAVAAGDIQVALHLLASLRQKLDGDPGPPDWMADSPEKVLLDDELGFLSALIALL